MSKVVVTQAYSIVYGISELRRSNSGLHFPFVADFLLLEDLPACLSASALAFDGACVCLYSCSSSWVGWFALRF